MLKKIVVAFFYAYKLRHNFSLKKLLNILVFLIELQQR